MIFLLGAFAIAKAYIFFRDLLSGCRYPYPSPGVVLGQSISFQALEAWRARQSIQNKLVTGKVSVINKLAPEVSPRLLFFSSLYPL
jgi:hypothetical protein